MKDFGEHALAGSMSALKAADFPGTERDLEAELFGKRTVEERADDLETELGIGSRKGKGEQLKFHNKVFCPEDDTDRRLLNELLNDKETYKIFMWKDNWTAHGNIRIFVIYSERLDKKKKSKETLGDQPESLSNPA